MEYGRDPEKSEPAVVLHYSKAIIGDLDQIRVQIAIQVGDELNSRGLTQTQAGLQLEDPGPLVSEEGPHVLDWDLL